MNANEGLTLFLKNCIKEHGFTLSSHQEDKVLKDLSDWFQTDEFRNEKHDDVDFPKRMQTRFRNWCENALKSEIK